MRRRRSGQIAVGRHPKHQLRWREASGGPDAKGRESVGVRLGRVAAGVAERRVRTGLAGRCEEKRTRTRSIRIRLAMASDSRREWGNAKRKGEGGNENQ